MSKEEQADRQKMSAWKNSRQQNNGLEVTNGADQWVGGAFTKAAKAAYLKAVAVQSAKKKAVAVESAKKRFLPVDAVPLPKRGSSQQHGHCPEAAQAGWIAADGTFSKTNKGGKLQPGWMAPDGSLHITGAGRSYMEIKQEQAEAASSSSGGWGGGSSMGATESNSSSVSAGPRSDNTVFRSL